MKKPSSWCDSKGQIYRIVFVVLFMFFGGVKSVEALSFTTEIYSATFGSAQNGHEQKDEHQLWKTIMKGANVYDRSFVLSGSDSKKWKFVGGKLRNCGGTNCKAQGYFEGDLCTGEGRCCANWSVRWPSRNVGYTLQCTRPHNDDCKEIKSGDGTAYSGYWGQARGTPTLKCSDSDESQINLEASLEALFKMSNENLGRTVTILRDQNGGAIYNYWCERGSCSHPKYSWRDESPLLQLFVTHEIENTGVSSSEPVLPVFSRPQEQPESPSLASRCPEGTVFCGPGIVTGANMLSESLDSGISKSKDLRSKIIDWTTYLYPLAAILAVVALIYAGFLYITAFDDDSKVESAKKILTWVVLGILLILGSFALVNSLITGVFG